MIAREVERASAATRSPCAARVHAACVAAFALAGLAAGACRGPYASPRCNPASPNEACVPDPADCASDPDAEGCTSFAPRAVVSALRPDMPVAGELGPAYDPGDEIEHLDSPAFRVHFTRAGRHAVPASDGDRDGTPDYVQDVAGEYEAVRAYYRDELGFLEPLSDADAPRAEGGDGGDSRFDVYLIDFGTSSDGAFRAQTCAPGAAHRCSGYMLQENDFDGRNYPSLELATRILASHEYFHAVQAAYRADAGAVLGEGTAVWASEAYDPSLEDFEGFANGYLARTERSLTTEPTGPVDPFAYGSALFFQFISERYEPSIIRELWQALLEQPTWPEPLDQILGDAHGTSLADAFAEFTRWNLYTGARADRAQSYARGEAYPLVTETALELPHSDESVRVFPLSARFYRARAGAPEAIRLAVVPGADQTSLNGLQLFLAREQRGAITAFEEADASQRDALSIDTSAGDTVHAVLLNTQLTGESLRPGVCLGTNRQVEACLRELRGESSPSSDAGAAGDASSSDDAGQPERPSASGGCSTTQVEHSSAWLLASLALGAWSFRRRLQL